MRIKEIIREINNIRDEKHLLNLVNKLKAEIILLLSENSARLERGDVKEIKMAIDELIDKFNEEFVNYLTENQKRLFWRGIKIIDLLIEKQTTEKLTLPFVDESILDILADYNADLVKGLTDQTRKQIKNLITQGVLGAKSPAEIIKEISTRLPSKSIFRSLFDRAQVIQRTEFNRVYAHATFERFKQWGQILKDKLYKKWVHSHLGVPRKGHLALDGVEIPWDEDFVIVGRKKVYKAFGPHDPTLPAEEVVNCRCIIVPVVKTDKK